MLSGVGNSRERNLSFFRLNMPADPLIQFIPQAVAIIQMVFQMFLKESYVLEIFEMIKT